MAQTLARSKEYLKPPCLFRDSHEMVTVMIGLPNNLKKFVLHKSFARFHCPVLRKALSGPFIEGQTQVYTIDDFEFPEAFGAVIEWMYTQKLDGLLKAIEGGYCMHNYLYTVWVLADGLLMPRLQNKVMDVARDFEFHSEETPGIPWIYKNTTPGSQLRSFIFSSMADDNYMQEDRKDLQILPAEFLVDWALWLTRFARPGLSNKSWCTMQAKWHCLRAAKLFSASFLRSQAQRLTLAPTIPHLHISPNLNTNIVYTCWSQSNCRY